MKFYDVLFGAGPDQEKALRSAIALLSQANDPTLRIVENAKGSSGLCLLRVHQSHLEFVRGILDDRQLKNLVVVHGTESPALSSVAFDWAHD